MTHIPNASSAPLSSIGVNYSYLFYVKFMCIGI